MVNLLNQRFLLTLAFIEGAPSMAIELFNAKIIAHFIGSALNVKAAVLTVTLFALKVGYYVGGYISKNDHKILRALLLVGVLITFILCNARWIMIEMINLSIQTGVTFSLYFFLLSISKKDFCNFFIRFFQIGRQSLDEERKFLITI